jgi:hypothetical protein|tara:strand:+ start:232 stop:531 length:300 start_codon:yes stop_codon:yes gene_type:complete
MNTLTIFIFGFIDNAVMGLSFYFLFLNVEILINKHMKIKASQFLIGIISAMLANSVSDAAGFVFQNEIYLGFIVGIGCLAGLVIIPIMEFIKIRGLLND